MGTQRGFSRLEEIDVGWKKMRSGHACGDFTDKSPITATTQLRVFILILGNTTAIRRLTDTKHDNRVCAEKTAQGGFVTTEASVRGVSRLNIWGTEFAGRA